MHVLLIILKEHNKYKRKRHDVLRKQFERKKEKTVGNTTTSGQHPLIGVIKDQVLMIGLRAAGRGLEVLKAQRTVVALF